MLWKEWFNWNQGAPLRTSMIADDLDLLVCRKLVSYMRLNKTLSRLLFILNGLLICFKVRKSPHLQTNAGRKLHSFLLNWNSKSPHAKYKYSSSTWNLFYYLLFICLYEVLVNSFLSWLSKTQDVGNYFAYHVPFARAPKKKKKIISSL